MRFRSHGVSLRDVASTLMGLDGVSVEFVEGRLHFPVPPIPVFGEFKDGGWWSGDRIRVRSDATGAGLAMAHLGPNPGGASGLIVYDSATVSHVEVLRRVLMEILSGRPDGYVLWRGIPLLAADGTAFVNRPRDEPDWYWGWNQAHAPGEPFAVVEQAADREDPT